MKKDPLNLNVKLEEQSMCKPDDFKGKVTNKSSNFAYKRYAKQTEAETARHKLWKQTQTRLKAQE